MNLVRTSLLNVVAVVVKIISALALNKILAVFVGPSGYALLGQLQNAMSMLTSLASGAVSVGVTKYTAEYEGDETRQHAVWRTAVAVGLTGSVVIGLLILIFHRTLALHFFKDSVYADTFLWFAGTLGFFVFNALLLAILNGKKEIKRFVVANIAGSLASLLITGLLAIYCGAYGALVSLAINQSLVFFITAWLCWKTAWFRLAYFIGRLDKPAFRGLAQYTVMSIATATLGPLAYILVRNWLAVRFSLEAAGHWEALMRISGVYLMLVTTPLSVYYLPRLSELQNKSELRREILNGFEILIPVAALGSVIIFMLRDWIILTLFTKDFIGMSKLFAWQMVGDVLKIASWLLSFFLLSKAMTKIFLITEILFTASYVMLAWIAMLYFAEQGAQIAYCVNYAFYFLFLGYVVWKNISELEQTT